MFEIEKATNGTYTSREKVNGRITRSNSGVDTPQKAFANICSWLKQDGKHLGVKVTAKKAKGKSQIEVETKAESAAATIIINRIIKVKVI